MLTATLERDATHDTLGGYAEIEPDPQPGIFEIGLVMAGAVSAGAYTAGVFDFLIEALDCWEAAKRQCALHSSDTTQWAIPGHQVKMRVVSGASAGAMTGAIAAVALNYGFPHGRGGTTFASNPFYRAWVEQIDITKLLGQRDLQDRNAGVVSLLDSTTLNDILDEALGYRGCSPPERPYLMPDVRFILTQGNLRGIPYLLSLRGNVEGGIAMIAHSDYQSFCVNFAGGPARPRRADDIALGVHDGKIDDAWRALGNAALASGAFPIGLAPRTIKREAKDFDWRFVLVPGAARSRPYAKLQPLWMGPKPPEPYQSLIVDGGTMNNEPLELARIDLAGIIGRNRREGERANRATILIDPFPHNGGTVDDPTRGQDQGIAAVLMSLMNAWKDQARFSPVDLALADDKNTFSRFLVAPTRGASAVSNGFALACGALGGFSGFLCQAYRHHDFMLGRHNCQEFLRKHFCLPVGNQPVFSAVNPALKQSNSPWLAPGGGPARMPIIPLTGSAKLPQHLPPWPAGAFDPPALRKLQKARLDTVLDRLLRSSDLNWFSRGVAKLGLWSARNTALDKSIAIITKLLRERKLL